MVAGLVFMDRPGTITPLRNSLTCYPNDVWLYILAARWRRLEQELPLERRCAEVGDDLVAARLARALVHLAFFEGRSWAS